MKKSIKYILFLCLILVFGIVSFKSYEKYEEKRLDETSTLLLLPENDNSDREILESNNTEKNTKNETDVQEQKTNVTKANENVKKDIDTQDKETNNGDNLNKSTNTKTTKHNTNATESKGKTATNEVSKENKNVDEDTKTDTSKQNTKVEESTKAETVKHNTNATESNEKNKGKTATNEVSKENKNVDEDTKTDSSKQNTKVEESSKTATNINTKIDSNGDTNNNTSEQTGSNDNNTVKTDTVKINGNRCYRDNATTILYYITECDSNTCKYTKKNDKVESGTVIRNKLSLSTNDCGSNKIVKDGNIIGATAFTAVNNKKYLKSEASNNSTSITILKVGEPFTILSTNSNDSWWKVDYNGKIGYVENAYCMINLPDYIPSIVYDIKDANPNMYTASGVKLSIYGKTLYNTGKVYNERLGRNEYISPVVYSFAKKILVAQRQAQSEGYLLEINDSYRPKHVADELRDSLAQVYYSNSIARNGIDYSYENGRKVYWGQGWFIAQSLSSHSVGAAIDVVLVDKGTGRELPQQSSFYDLSTNAVKYNTPISGQTTVRTSLYSTKANKQTKDLDRIMLSTGMTNLASEWWHFQDNDAYRRIKSIEPSGLDFEPNRVVSTK